MAALPSLLLLLIISSSSSASASASASSQFSQPRSTYIVHVLETQKPAAFHTHTHWYSSILHSLLSSSPHQPHPVLLYSYRRAAAGFSAVLTASQAASLRRLHPSAVLSVVPDSPRFLHTTRTPHFLHLSPLSGLWPNSDYASDVVVGVLDTGIWPERRSFNSSFSAAPPDWKGECEDSSEFSAKEACCNSGKIVGARAFYRGYEAAIGRKMDESEESRSPRDTEGHGTHTASTAAGNAVEGAGFYDFAKGEARGMAEKAKIAVYKICWKLGCFDSDILAAMDQAILDGVDVISLSVGANGLAPQYYRDSIAIGAFGAAQHGVLVSCSAGNSGPSPFTAVNIAPWILTVGASTLDREFPADVVLGDGRVFKGVSLYSGDPLNENVYLDLVYSADCGSKYCYEGELNAARVGGKLVICDRGGNARVAKGNAVKLAGGLGMILGNTAESGEELIADSHLIPATTVGSAAADQIREYVCSSPNPTATIKFRGTVIGSSSPPSPMVASFSSRGPNHLTPEILKPDVIAPGVNILAGWTGFVGPTGLEIDPRRVEFNIISGTSMSCPHVSGLAALLRKAHPSWSPAAIKSALMTTAYLSDNSGKNIADLGTGGEEATPFVTGSGHVDPNRALDPGLVYDIGPADYVSFLCSIGYDSRMISVFLRDHAGAAAADCGNYKKLSSPGDLNYPAFSVVFEPGKDEVWYRRTVRNVGVGVGGGESAAAAMYDVSVSAPPNVNVSVYPSSLAFVELNQTLSYDIKFTSIISSTSLLVLGGGGDHLASASSNASAAAAAAAATDTGKKSSSSFGWIEWTDGGGSHRVRSPIAVRWILDQQRLVASS